ncbi:lipoprotein [Desulfospira joergensenii]|uniref:lipoprotein n=1 Tax=Desulfospira joergensenii TaxID=53329 RepID=UPI001294755F|nr:lipoprotein [Desulfospira joergensenii]
MRKTIFLLLLALVVSSCATTAGYKKIVESWIGASELDLIRSWGPPQQTYETGGVKFLVYNSSRNVYLPGRAPTYSTKVIGNTAYTTSSGGRPARNLNYNCQTTFEVIDDKIVSWKFRGNDCTAEE